MERWLEELIDGWAYDREAIGRRIGFHPKSAKEVWKGGSGAPLIIWLAARQCSTDKERRAIFEAAMQCVQISMQELNGLRFDEKSILESFEGLVKWALDDTEFSHSNFGPLFTNIGALAASIEKARADLDEIRRFVPPVSLPENFDSLPAQHQQAIKRIYDRGDLSVYHRRFPNDLAILVLNAENVWLSCYYLLNSDSPTTSFSFDSILKEFLEYDEATRVIRLRENS